MPPPRPITASHIRPDHPIKSPRVENHNRHHPIHHPRPGVSPFKKRKTILGDAKRFCVACRFQQKTEIRRLCEHNGQAV
ncbi:hypothetical protein CEXT_309261 [Caerostris extrusa]|uniref:Uncharacterized protein n=1 Tax=Caerostris extrusa TaxID=172846 RepID=A0AAV4TQY6_CAEEX|nr:hypothetical protein CEXT_309261 [Caerostris extrusa]